MKIAFLCSSLEAGRDGVGDNTVQLATEIQKLGHQVGLIALNDPWITDPQTSGDRGVQVWRFPQGQEIAARASLARDLLSQFAPDWVSLQYVCYGFHPKGLPFRWNRLLPSIIPRFTLVHVMLHELWIGVAESASLRERFVGRLQRTLLVGLLAQLRPRVISTSNKVYQDILSMAGVKSCVIPLIGNIPIVSPANPSQTFAACAKNSVDCSADTRERFSMGGFFATLHPEWPSEPFLSLWEKAATHRGQTPVLLCAGRLGPGAALWERLIGRSGGVRFVSLGEQPPEEISNYLQTLDFGIASSPLSLLGKSSVVASMIEHGLPVVANRNDWRPRGIRVGAESQHPIYPLDDRLGACLTAGLPRGLMKSRLNEIATRFIDKLQENGMKGRFLDSDGATHDGQSAIQ